MGKERNGDFESYSIIINDSYFSDLTKITDYIEFVKLEPISALQVARGINATMKKIICNPTIYSECDNIPTKSKIYREAIYKKWHIVFKLKADQITILRVYSGKIKPSKFKKGL